ncbi:hypothetical protein EJ04DRAFT_163462 [Polyplosphaeria fusca]|uniref:Shugoshin n=1 Tax=Polyplosphaeria fusca TaxID=682080 RepID=A0A9P4R9R7_9PLEO|nr:hypothetical protein EJ04DRAFT_163462 [Polyplosphaeria fusca]
MARLNEPPLAPAPAPATETVEVGRWENNPLPAHQLTVRDAVKRRFLRQNRELAKTNSQQSSRIRSLETEVSRLLAENLSLREQVLQLQNALETHTSRPSFENVDSVKDRLESKIQELGALVAELGQLKKSAAEPPCKSQTAATRRSPGERQWRSGLGLREVESAMLPTIVEDKHFPRRTMNSDEIRDLLDNQDSQSPDIGPPPVSRFESDEPIAFERSPPSESLAEEVMEDAEHTLPVNLETRKKRRESGPKLSIRRVSVFQSHSEGSDENTSKAVRAGAKRKLSVREDDDKTDMRRGTQAETFTFSRRNTPTPDANDDIVNTGDRGPSPEREILGTKPVNTDPTVSPKKQRSAATDKVDKKPPSLSKSARPRLVSSRKISHAILPPLEMPPEPPVPTDIPPDSLPPKTPAPEDFLSPPSTEPSTSRPESKDTPPPGDLSSTDQMGRPSRRARAQVSYKEPSLNTKMRRPGKELVAAVQPEQNSRHSMEPLVPSTVTKTFIKSDAVESDSWKGLPTAVRGEEVGESPLKEKLGRREDVQCGESTTVPELPKLNSSAASNAISALIAGSTKKKSAPGADNLSDPITRPWVPQSTLSGGEDVNGLPAEEQGRDSMTIFDFTDSSPNGAPATTRPRVDLAKATKTRRHSSIPESIVLEERKPEVRGRQDGCLPTLHSRTGSAGSVKSASTSNLGKVLVPSATSIKNNPKSKRTGNLPASGSTMDLPSAAGKAAMTDTGSLRAERAATRRKSTLL